METKIKELSKVEKKIIELNSLNEVITKINTRIEMVTDYIATEEEICKSGTEAKYHYNDLQNLQYEFQYLKLVIQTLENLI